MKNQNQLYYNNRKEPVRCLLRIKLSITGIVFCSLLIIGLVSLNSCKKDLLEQLPTTQVSFELFWKTTNDAIYAVNGVYQSNRSCFGNDYWFDGGGEFVYTTGNYYPGPMGGSFSSLWNSHYQTINRANYVLANFPAMKEKAISKPASELATLKRLEGEVRFLRAINYFRLIDLWGDVPYFGNVLNGNTEAYSLTRTPRAVIKDSILLDLDFAASVLPDKYTGDDQGRATRLAALGFSGKVKLFWACWMKNEGNTTEAQAYYASAAQDFKKVVDSGRKLFRNGDPGSATLPNYWHLFQYYSENDDEIIFSINYASPNLGQGESLMQSFGNGNTENSSGNVSPLYRLVNRYQLLSGDFAPPLVLSNNPNTVNGSINPASYYNRDYRMKATIMWDGQKMRGIIALQLMDSIPLKYLAGDGVNYLNYGSAKGWLFRKWIRQVGGLGGRDDGPQDFYLMRLADVYLMYCEAINETTGPNAELVGLINQIRHRGNLPDLAPQKYAAKDEFFKAIEQERIVELVGEGQRFFDIRRWKKLETIWPIPSGEVLFDSHGIKVRDEFVSAPVRDYHRYYIFQIPTTEREKNPNLTQNEPWL